MAGVLAGTLAGPGPAGAAPTSDRSTVAVIRATEGGAAGQELATRIIAELTASSVGVLTIGCAVIDAACLGVPRTNVAATVLVFQRNRLAAVEVRVPQIAGRERRIDVGSGEDASPAALAVRTAEVLHTVLLESPEAPQASDRQAAAAAVSTRPDERRGTQIDDDEGTSVARSSPLLAPATPPALALRLGAAMFGSPGGLAPSFGAAATVLHPLTGFLDGALSFSGAALGGQEQSPAGEATVEQALALVQIALRGTLARSLTGRIGLGAGVHYLRVAGSRAPPFLDSAPAVTESRLSPAFAGTASAAVALSRHLAVFVEGQVYFLTRIPVILIDDTEVGRTGAPGLALVAGGEFHL